MKKISVARVVAYVLASLYLLITIVPFFYMVLTSLKSSQDLMSSGAFSFPSSLYWGNYEKVLKGNFPLYFRNSVIVVSFSVVFVVMLSCMSSYVFSRLTNKLTTKLYALVIACMSIPIHITYVPLFLMAKKFGTYDSIIGLIVPYVTFYLPISTFIMTGFMRNIPHEMEEAARIDGCTLSQTFYRIIVPLSKPGLVTIAIYDAIYIWNEFSLALILTQSTVSRTIPMAIWDFKAEFTVNIPGIMAVLTLAAIPMIIAFAIGQDKLVKGMMAGAVKG